MTREKKADPSSPKDEEQSNIYLTKAREWRKAAGDKEVSGAEMEAAMKNYDAVYDGIRP